MGKAPLPFDDMPKCTCHAGCPDFVNFTSRYWVVIPNPDVPRLLAGIFMERQPFADNFKDCVWREDPPVLPFNTSTLRKTVGFLAPPGQWEWVMVFEQPVFGRFYRSNLIQDNVPCGQDSILEKTQGPTGWLNTFVTRIEWWENADDVPH